MKTAPVVGSVEDSIAVMTFVLGQGPRAIPIRYAQPYWPTLCTLAEAQATRDAIRTLDTSAKGGSDSVAVSVDVMDFSGQGEFSLLSIPDKCSLRNYCVVGKAVKLGVEYVINEYGALVPEQLQKGWTTPSPTAVLKMTVNDSSGVQFSWGA